MLDVKQIQNSVSKHAEKYGVQSAYLFGSYAKNTATENSDIDIIIEKGNLRTYDAYSDFKFAIEDELGRKVDLLTTESVRPRFFELIKNDRILLYGA